MQLSERQKQWLVWGVIVVLIAVSGFFGITNPIPVPPVPQGPQPAATALLTGGVSNFNALQVRNDIVAGRYVTATAGLYSPGTTTLTGDVSAVNIAASGTAKVTGASWFTGTSTHAGAVTADGGLTVDTTAFSVADTSGNTTIAGTLTVTGAQTLVGDTTASGNLEASGYVTATTSLYSAGATALDGGLTMDTTKFVVADTSGNTTIAGTLTVTGAQTLVGNTTASGNLSAAGYVTATTSLYSAGDVTISADSTGGNAGAKNELAGLPRIKFVSTAVGTNGTTESTLYVDDSPTGEYAPIDADVTEAEGSGDSIYRWGASSYKAMFAVTAAADDGFKRTIAGDDLEANESIGCWLYPTATVASGDLQILLTDDGGARNFNIGALTANKWNWVEIDISSLAAGTGNSVTEFGVTLTAQGETAQGYLTLYMDSCYKWDAADEEALGAAILQDGVLGVIAIVDANTGVHTTSILVEGTDYFVHYETGSDFIVWLTDQSANSATVMFAY